jgi:thioredoxin-like negative regulator of GroEL
MKDLSLEEFEETIKSSTSTLIEFWSPACFACIDAETFLLKLEQAYKNRCNLAKVNVEQSDLIATYNLIKLPTFILFKNSVELARVTGYKNKENDIERIIRLNL